MRVEWSGVARESCLSVLGTCCGEDAGETGAGHTTLRRSLRLQCEEGVVIIVIIGRLTAGFLGCACVLDAGTRVTSDECWGRGHSSRACLYLCEGVWVDLASVRVQQA